LWSTVPHLPQAIEVMEEWGFTYVSLFGWIKNKAGTGYWVRNRLELLLIGKRGNIPCPAPGCQFDSVIEAPVREHSRKPDVAYEMIEAMFPTLPKIELFARAARDGFDCWGNEAPFQTEASA
jgi:N6-adenosine-specific RNA methylase IME4